MTTYGAVSGAWKVDEMAFPADVPAQPARATKQSGGDGLKHREYDDAAWARHAAVETFLVGSSAGEATLLARLNQIIAATQTLRTVNGTAGATAVGPSAGATTGLYFSGGDTYVSAGSTAVAQFTATIAQVLKNLGVTEQIYAPNMATTVSGGLFVKWDATAGQFLRATSQRALKENEREIGAEASDIIKGLRPVLYDARGREIDRPGVTVDIPGFIAEDLAESIPGLAAVDEDGTPIGRADDAILAVAVAALKDALARIEALEARLDAA